MKTLGCVLAFLLLMPMARAADVAKISTFTLADSGCGGGSNLENVQCLSSYLRWLDGELNKVYRLALNALPEKDPNDERRERTQLRKSQRAWLQYKTENCALVGGMEGSSNLWVTHFAALCEEQALRERIKFLNSIAGVK